MRKKDVDWRNPTGRCNVIEELELEAKYTYIGIEEGEDMKHFKMKAKIQKEYKGMIKLVLKSEFNARKQLLSTFWLSHWSHTATKL